MIFLRGAPDHSKSDSGHSNYCANISSGNTSIPFSLFLSSVNLMHDDTGAILMFQELSIFVVYFTVLIYQKYTPHLDALNFGSCW